jgi:hypothetical protein
MASKKGKVVWIKCRAKSSCEGNQAKILRRFPLPMGGTSLHYKCLTCKNVFTVTL